MCDISKSNELEVCFASSWHCARASLARFHLQVCPDNLLIVCDWFGLPLGMDEISQQAPKVPVRLSTLVQWKVAAKTL